MHKMGKPILLAELFITVSLSLSYCSGDGSRLYFSPSGGRLKELDGRMQEREVDEGERHANSVSPPSLPELSTDVETEVETVACEMEDAVSTVCGELSSRRRDFSWHDFDSLLDRTISRLEAEETRFAKAMEKLSSVEAVVNETLTRAFEQWQSGRLEQPTAKPCKEGWHHFEGSCYFFSFSEGDWLHGRQECQEMGGDYVKINNTREWNFVASHVTGNAFVGLSDDEEEGTFKWISDGTVYSDWHDSWWHRGQPDNHHGGENCIHFWLIYDKLLWNDTKCTERMRYICEMKASDVEA